MDNIVIALRGTNEQELFARVCEAAKKEKWISSLVGQKTIEWIYLEDSDENTLKYDNIIDIQNLDSILEIQKILQDFKYNSTQVNMKIDFEQGISKTLIKNEFENSDGEMFAFDFDLISKIDLSTGDHQVTRYEDPNLVELIDGYFGEESITIFNRNCFADLASGLGVDISNISAAFMGFVESLLNETQETWAAIIKSRTILSHSIAQ